MIGDGFVADDFGFAVVLRIVELHLFENIKVDVLASDVAHLHLAERGPEVLANDALVALLAALQGGSTFEPMAFRKPKVIVLGKDYRYLRNEDEIQRFLRAARDEGEMTYMLARSGSASSEAQRFLRLLERLFERSPFDDMFIRMLSRAERT